MFTVVQTKAGYIVQNTKTNVVVAVYPTKVQAETVVLKLNK